MWKYGGISDSRRCPLRALCCVYGGWIGVRAHVLAAGRQVEIAGWCVLGSPPPSGRAELMVAAGRASPEEEVPACHGSQRPDGHRAGHLASTPRCLPVTEASGPTDTAPVKSAARRGVWSARDWGRR